MNDYHVVNRNLVWRPSADYIEKSNLRKFMEIHGIKSVKELQRRSVEDISWFTDAVIKFLGIDFRKPYSKVVDLSDGIQFPVWCVDGKLNITRNCVDRWASDEKSRNRAAVIWEGEEGSISTLSYRELAEQVNRCANAFRSLGLGKGDVIGLFMPMIPETVVALLAIARIGGVILPLFSGYGAGAVAQRLADSEAKGLITVDGLLRRGNLIPIKTVADAATKKVSSIRNMIVVRRAGNEIPFRPGTDLWWHELVPSQDTVSDIAGTDAEDIVMIIYTSGTTGSPKGTVHTHCGFPVKAAQDMAFGTDVHQGDIIYWITDIGWMMGPWLIFGSTILGATCFISDGAPDFPEPDRVWKMVADHKINILGISPTFIRSQMVHGEDLVKNHDLSSIRFFASTSEPWNPDSWLWLFDKVGRRKSPIINYSGGTEISGGILMGNPLTPLKPASFSGPCPGMDADVVDMNGKSVRGETGELVIRSPWIGMTRGFWKDRQRYLDTYWSRWENIWVHGDRAAVDDGGLWYILGRSDDTIKVAGKRVGPAEIESLLVNHPAVREAAAIGIPHPVKGNEVICFCVLKQGEQMSDNLKEQLMEKIVSEMGKPMRPGGVEIIRDIPKTRNGKIMRRIIRAAYLDLETGDYSGLANPEAVDEIRKAGGAS
jgi:acetyl-CoA synthetase